MERRITTRPNACRMERREDGSGILRGYAAVFYRAGDAGTQYELWRGAVERIEAGAFAEAITRSDDVRALFNHDSNHVLGRSTAETLRLVEDEQGLAYEIDLPPTQLAADLATSIERGDITGSSFAFAVDVVEWSKDEDVEVRTIKSVTLYDVGPVTYPAYTGTTTAVRAGTDDAAEAKLENDRWRRGSEATWRRRAARLRLLDSRTRRGL